MPTATTARTFTPADHGRPVDPDEFEAGDFAPGAKYEIIDGTVYVSARPEMPEAILEGWLQGAIMGFSARRPDVVAFVASKSRVFIPRAGGRTVPEPDIAVYAAVPNVPIRDMNWRNMRPMIVAEVLVDADPDKDLVRNPLLYLRDPGIGEYWVLDGRRDPDEPSLIRHVRAGTGWVIDTVPFGGTLTSPLLPGFSLALNPRPAV